MTIERNEHPRATAIRNVAQHLDLSLAETCRRLHVSRNSFKRWSYVYDGSSSEDKYYALPSSVLDAPPKKLQTRALMFLLSLIDVEFAWRKNNGELMSERILRAKQHAMLAAKEYYEHEKEIARLKREITRLRATDAA